MGLKLGTGGCGPLQVLWGQAGNRSTGGRRCFWSAARTVSGKPAPGTWSASAVAVFDLEPHGGFSSSYLGSRTPTKTLLSIDGRQIVVYVGGREPAPPVPHLAAVTLPVL